MQYFGMGCLIFLVAAVISWAITAAIVWAICALFKLTFSLAIATGIWLIMVLLKSVFSSGSGK